MPKDLMQRRQWTWVPPAVSGTQVEGTGLLPIGRYKMPDGSEQVSFGLPQPMLDAVRALGYAGGRDQDPAAAPGYVSQGALMKGGQGLAESAMVGSLAAGAPRGALRAGLARGVGNVADDIVRRELDAGLSPLEIIKKAKAGAYSQAPKRNEVPGWNRQENKTLRSGNELSRNADDLSVYRSDGSGTVEGTPGPDPQILSSSVDNPGQGVGSSLYRDWANEAGGPFRSDGSVSPQAQTIYDKMFPKYGYNVLKNPDAIRHADGTLTSGNEALQHVYRVEPPGMKSTEFYANPMTGAIPLMWQQQEQSEPKDLMKRKRKK